MIARHDLVPHIVGPDLFIPDNDRHLLASRSGLFQRLLQLFTFGRIFQVRKNRFVFETEIVDLRLGDDGGDGSRGEPGIEKVRLL